LTSTPLPIVVTRVLSASPEEVFDAWTDPKSLAVWMCPGSVKGSVVTGAKKASGPASSEVGR
jgi:uncharacterized protein YndB with AHSA1/START domain